MMKRRKPKDLEAYVSAEEVAKSLEQLAGDIRKGGRLARYSIQFWFWEAPPVAKREERSSAP